MCKILVLQCLHCVVYFLKADNYKLLKKHYVHIWMFLAGSSRGSQKMAPARPKRLRLAGSHMGHPQLKAPLVLLVFCLSCLQLDVTYN